MKEEKSDTSQTKEEARSALKRELSGIPKIFERYENSGAISDLITAASKVKTETRKAELSEEAVVEVNNFINVINKIVNIRDTRIDDAISYFCLALAAFIGLINQSLSYQKAEDGKSYEPSGAVTVFCGILVVAGAAFKFRSMYRSVNKNIAIECINSRNALTKVNSVIDKEKDISNNILKADLASHVENIFKSHVEKEEKRRQMQRNLVQITIDCEEVMSALKVIKSNTASSSSSSPTHIDTLINQLTNIKKLTRVASCNGVVENNDAEKLGQAGGVVTTALKQISEDGISAELRADLSDLTITITRIKINSQLQQADNGAGITNRN